MLIRRSRQIKNIIWFTLSFTSILLLFNLYAIQIDLHIEALYAIVITGYCHPRHIYVYSNWVWSVAAI